MAQQGKFRDMFEKKQNRFNVWLHKKIVAFVNNPLREEWEKKKNNQYTAPCLTKPQQLFPVSVATWHTSRYLLY